MRWTEWTPARVLVAVVVLCISSAGGLFFLWNGVWEAAPLFGVEPSDHEEAGAAFYYLLSATCMALGPLAIWGLRRTRPWLLAGAGLALYPALLAIASFARA